MPSRSFGWAHPQLVAVMMVWVSAWLGGCASAPSLPAIGKAEPYAVVVTEIAPASGELSIQNTAVGKDSRVGLGTGMVAGGLWGLTCGPLAPLCVPLSAVVVGTVGGVAGLAIGATGELPAQKAAQVRERLSRVRRSHDLVGELRTHIGQRAGGRREPGPGPSNTLVAVELQELQLFSTRDERMGFVMRVQVSVRPAGAASPRAARQKQYEYTAPLSNLSVWLNEQSDFLDLSLRSASEQIAAQIVSELALN